MVLFIPSYGDGGVERNFVFLANGLTQMGYPVSLLVRHSHCVFLDQLREEVELCRLAGADERELTRELLAFLAPRPATVVMTGQHRDDCIAIAARRQIRSTGPRFFISVGTPLSQQARESHRFWPKRWWYRRRLRTLFSHCDGIIANARGVARDLTDFLGVPPARIAVAPNPVVAPELPQRAAEPVRHPWLSDTAIPVVMAAGRLSRVKDFPTLLRAFALLRASRPCRLMILGEGRQRAKLERLAQALGIAGDIELTGFVDNPYAYLARAAVFVVSSLREGGPNVLIEALACGTPVVATDCPYGPREILEDGHWGALVPVGEPEALAQAIDATLGNPLPAALLKTAAERYSVEQSTRRYLEAFGLTEPSQPAASPGPEPLAQRPVHLTGAAR